MTTVGIQPDFNIGTVSEEKRQSNWTLFKKLCDEQKLHGGMIDLGNEVIEVFHKDKELIRMEDDQKLSIKGNGYKLVFYPSTPRLGYNYVFDLAYGSELGIIGGELSLAERPAHTTGNDPDIFNLINNFPKEVIGPDTVINLTDVKIENWQFPINISSGAFKINLKGVVEINNAEIALAVFARSQLNHQSILGHDATLILRNNGVKLPNDIYGSGAYIHPTVIVQIDKVRGYDNQAFTFRQFSSSIEVNCPEDYQSWIHDFQCEGSKEGDLRTSNCMPFVVDHYKGDSVLSPGGNLIVKSGEIGTIQFTTLFHPPDNTKSFIQVNNATIHRKVSIAWPKLVAEFADVEMNDCLLLAERSENGVKIFAAAAMIKSIKVKNCRYERPKGSTIQDYLPEKPPTDNNDSAASLILTAGFLEVNLDGITTDFMKGAFLQQNITQTQPPADKVIIHLNHCEINTSNFYNDNPNSPRFLPGQIQGIETTVLNYFDWTKRAWVKLSGNWNVP